MALSFEVQANVLTGLKAIAQSTNVTAASFVALSCLKLCEQYPGLLQPLSNETVSSEPSWDRVIKNIFFSSLDFLRPYSKQLDEYQITERRDKKEDFYSPLHRYVFALRNEAAKTLIGISNGTTGNYPHSVNRANTCLSILRNMPNLFSNFLLDSPIDLETFYTFFKNIDDLVSFLLYLQNTKLLLLRYFVLVT